MRVHHCELTEPIPKGAKITISTRTNPVDITIPFEIDDIPVTAGE